MIDQEAWLKRADQVLATVGMWNYSEALQFATSMISAFYGPESPQMKTFRATTEGIHKAKQAVPHNLSVHANATISNIQAEIKGGLVKSVRTLIAGEIIAELVALSKETSSDNSEHAKNVSAVLVAAAFEDIIRRMGAEFAAVSGRPKLEVVITELKAKDVLKGGEPTTALGYLKFRNDSLHADWSKVERSQVLSCLAFVEALLVKHFS